MTITPFLAVRLRRKKDALLSRQRARRVAQLLQFDEHEQACVAAGAFMIACQALERFDRGQLCFQIENHQLHVFAEENRSQLPAPTAAVSDRLAGLLPPVEPKSLYRMVKPLPQLENCREDVDIAWLLASVEATGGMGVFDEIVKQNQEVLALLHELRSYRVDAQKCMKIRLTPMPRD